VSTWKVTGKCQKGRNRPGKFTIVVDGENPQQAARNAREELEAAGYHSVKVSKIERTRWLFDEE